MRTKKLSLVVVPLLLTACSQNNVLLQDVYDNQYSCQQDWHPDLCEKQSTSYSGGWTGQSTYIGPQYYQNIRRVRYLGRVVKATGRHQQGNPIISKTINPNAKSKPIARRGFGNTVSTHPSSGSGGG